jgi:glycerophosphoryl diester phosphodiesterase
VDIHLSRDGHLVVFHDGTTRRLAGVKAAVSAQTLKELKRLDVGRWKGPEWVGERIPTLGEVLATVPQGKRLFVEIKCGKACVPILVDDIKKSGKDTEQIVVVGSDLDTLICLKKLTPKLEVCWVPLFPHTVLGGWRAKARQLIHSVVTAGLDGLDLGSKAPVDASFVAQVHKANLKLYIWTVDSVVHAKKLAAAGVDGITTTRPGWLRTRL